MPKRIQRKRTKGWRMPENTVYVGRPTKWGNCFKLGPNGTDARADLLAAFEALATRPFFVAEVRRELRGKDLACWCPLDQLCHADVLLKLANGSDEAAAL